MPIQSIVRNNASLTFTPGFNVLVGKDSDSLTSMLDVIAAVLQSSAPEEDLGATFDLKIECTSQGDVAHKTHRDGHPTLVSKPWVIRLSPVLTGRMDIFQVLQGYISTSDPFTDIVVLIDGLEVGLHPNAQRKLLHTLINTFPQCQFIATTHSPVIISELRREQVHILTSEGVEHPDYCYGQDANTILESVMGVQCRPVLIQNALDNIANLASLETTHAARQALLSLASKLELGENDPELAGLATTLHFLESWSDDD